ncbi:MAG: glycosyltransferase family 9 protein [Fimbriimonadaceae bacterium]|nr:MAG: glycosyltransferase family 9 protein [Fimbriimonadaceae bacterium]
MRILAVRFSAIGDCVMTAWAVTGIREALPHAEIVWAVQDTCRPVLDEERLVTSVVEIPRKRWKAGRWRPEVWHEQLRLYLGIRKNRFDVGFDFQGHSKTSLMLRLARCGSRKSAYAKDAAARLLVPPTACRHEHIVEVSHHLVNQWTPTTLPRLPLMPRVSAPDGIRGPCVTLLTGASDPTRRYPATHWQFVAQKLVSQGCQVVALGGPEDPRIDAPEVVDLVGKLSLRESMAWIAHSQLHLAADTGSGHIAAAYGVPIVSLFSNKSPARSRPWGDRVTVLHNGPDASRINPEEVVRAAEAWLQDYAVPR